MLIIGGVDDERDDGAEDDPDDDEVKQHKFEFVFTWSSSIKSMGFVGF